jgi:hypothetical protein
MWFIKWLDQQAFSYSDWLPWRRARGALAVVVALTAVLVPGAFRAAGLAYVHHEEVVVTGLLTKTEHEMFCGPKQPESVRIAFCSRVGERDQAPGEVFHEGRSGKLAGGLPLHRQPDVRIVLANLYELLNRG